MLAVWYGDRSTAIFVAVLSALVWWWADVKAGHPYFTNWGQVWETVVRLSFFLFVAAGGTAMKTQKDAIKSRMQALERAGELEREIVRVSEAEQQRIGRDLHDGLCQYLAAVGCAASELKEDLRAKSLPEAAEAEEIQNLLRGAVTQTRDLARGIFPVQMDESGLAGALAELAGNTTRHTQTAVRFESADGMVIHDRDRSMHLYRIAQEALHNAIRHGGARHVTIRLDGDESRPRLTITDDGTGFPNAGAICGMGLKTMGYRANLIGARIQKGNQPGGGAFVSCVSKSEATEAPHKA
jgi:signal transduction histidine kinase